MRSPHLSIRAVLAAVAVALVAAVGPATAAARGDFVAPRDEFIPFATDFPPGAEQTAGDDGGSGIDLGDGVAAGAIGAAATGAAALALVAAARRRRVLA